MNAPKAVEDWLGAKGWTSRALHENDHSPLREWWTCGHHFGEPMSWEQAVALQMVLDHAN